MDSMMTVRRMRSTINPLYRWRWDACGAYGYSMTKRGACAQARAEIAAARVL